MASGSIMSSAAGKPITDAMLIDNLPKEINEMKINDDKEGKVVLGNRIHTLYMISFFPCLYLVIFASLTVIA